MTPTDHLLDLLADWEDQVRQGHDPSPEQLCPDRPELWEVLAQRIQRRRALLKHLEPPATVADATPPIPQISGYGILGTLGRGGMGVVYQARHLALNRTVAIKMIGLEARTDPMARRRFLQEARVLARLRHPAIVEIFDIGETDGQPFLVLEYMSGGSLADLLRHRTLAPDEAAEVLIRITDAIRFAHEQDVVHRDLKPGNILLSKTPSDGRLEMSAVDGSDSPAPVKVADFGLLKDMADTSSPTWTGAVLGTPSYMSPEQASGSLAVSFPSDIYSLGTVLYESLTGRPPFRGATRIETLHQVIHDEPVPPNQLHPGLPRDLNTICLKCLDKNPARRYSSAADLAADLRRFLQREPILARPPNWRERSWRWVRRHPVAGTAACITIAALVLIGVIVGRYNARLITERNQAESARQRAERNLGLALQTSRSLAQLARATGNQPSAEATASLGEAITAFEHLSQDYPEEPQYLDELGLLYYLRNRQDKTEATFQQALDTMRRAQTVREARVAAAPENIDDRRGLAQTIHNIGDLLAARSRKDEAATTISQALSLRQELAHRYPDERTNLDLALTRVLAARFSYFLKQDIPETLALSEQAIPVLEKAVASQPHAGALRARLADACGVEAMALAHQKRFSEAIRYWDRALADPSLVGTLRMKFRLSRIYCQARDGQHSLALQEADRLSRERDFELQMWSDLADTYAWCLIAGERDGSGLKNSAQVEPAIARLIQGLRSAHEANRLPVDDITYLREAAELAPLRSRSDFRTLVDSLGK